MNNSISIVTQNKCFSCRSCFLSCPKNAIEMIENEEGFFYPKVDETKCVNCGICIKKCPSVKIPDNGNFQQEVFAAYCKNPEQLLKSASGAASSVFASHIIKENGVVFGVAYDSDLFVHHVSCRSEDELDKIKGSKYVESFTGDTYIEAKEYLEEGKKVLYTGSPCQIAGLKKYLGKEYENLFTVDLICHGVPSRKLFRKYLDWLGHKNKGKIIYYGFRDKDVGGWSCGGKAKTKTKTKTIEGSCDPYYSSFLKCETFRESCYSCPFANSRRISDITIGDFWGIEKYYPEIKKQNGVSCILINSTKGKELFDSVNEEFEYTNCKIEEVQDANTNLRQPAPRGKFRDEVYKEIDGDIREYFKKFKYPSIIKVRGRVLISKLIPKSVKKLLKKIMRIG